MALKGKQNVLGVTTCQRNVWCTVKEGIKATISVTESALETCET